MRKLIFATVLSFVGLTASAQEETAELQADETTVVSTAQDFEEISVSDLPEAIAAAVAKDYPTATVNKAYKNESNQFKLELSLEDGTSGTLYADSEGNWIEI
ncbi:hypothetical protein DKG77_04955 [Flagellimonas aquimarina]|jgi:hypothetical protein|uniref:Beta-lactamase-inhibitor-like PepSY-like domain-containing protein n=1 Tax=Flagellimonas aquimarina TaxID=2201895 RepID=A0A316L5I0_9FLAO|nr:hypothetical protein [Allomuricauda koreensis]PWL40175.1 hypothetical protein DKG77_04955 [Allomuricauda koreensis]